MSVVDGQQRLTTNYKAYCNHPDLKNVVLDLGKGEFVINTEAYRKNQVPVGILLNKDDNKLIAYTEKNKALASPMVVNALLQIRNKIKTYQYTINFATDLTEDEQINWFEVLNNAGSRVSIIQMRFSKLKAHGIDAVKLMMCIHNIHMYTAARYKNMDMIFSHHRKRMFHIRLQH